MRSRQTGITFIGWIVLLAPLAIVAFAGIKLSTVYLNYFKVSKAVEQVAAESVGQQPMNVAKMRTSLQSRFDVEGIALPAVKDIDIFRDGEQWVVEADYTDGTALFAGISLRVHFNKRAVVQ